MAECFSENRLLRAGMTELADVRDLGSCGEIRWGSTPHTRTIWLCGETGRHSGLKSRPALSHAGSTPDRATKYGTVP